MYRINNHPRWVDWFSFIGSESVSHGLWGWPKCPPRRGCRTEGLAWRGAGEKSGMQKEPTSKIDVMWASFDSFLGPVFFARIHIGLLSIFMGQRYREYHPCRISFRPFRMIASTRRAWDNCHSISLKHMKPAYENVSPPILLLQKDGMHKLVLHCSQRSNLLSWHFLKSKRS